ncbi:MAG: Na/Pi symporter [Gammaproteobacteria bacterium]|nr:Na/Pi symporter [Gammaproteobacteria bacterium]MBU2478386.1 Na/Pi symporter [Gammaproteobacteria bacterium]
MSTEHLALAGALAGGLGLFLLAVGMISQGLRVAAGRQLRRMLACWTGTRLRGVATGALITAVVQSSSAVTVATIGFVNAGILQLSQALGVIFGANVGTTMTGWLVAAVGFQFKLETYALPLIGLGMLLRLTGSNTRRGAFGEALAGFGLFFLGIDILRDAFAGLATSVELPQLVATTPLQLLALVGIGFLMTVLTQSSSAAIAIILTAASGEALALSGAAAMVIGANIGTTSTAVLAVIGATANAKRVAAGHILFNLLTGVIALLILPALLWLLETASSEMGQAAHPAVTLALFHTTFNFLGVLLMWPLAGRLAVFLEARFRTVDEVEGRPRFLDHTVAATPALAVDALVQELLRVVEISRRMARAAISTEQAPGRQIAIDAQTARTLAGAITAFVEKLGRQSLSEEVAQQLPQTLRALRYFQQVVNYAESIAGAQADGAPLLAVKLATRLDDYHAEIAGLLQAADPQQSDFKAESLTQRAATLEEHYQLLKAAFLRAGALGDIEIQGMSDTLEHISRCRRMAQQLNKGISLLTTLRQVSSPAETQTASVDVDADAM